jgi:hypothetical protein
MVIARGVLWAVSIVAAGAGFAACDSHSTANPSATPSADTTITIGAGGVATPRVIVVALGSQVTFVNNDRVVHEMYSNPHPEHTDCPEFDSVGRLAPGQTRQTTNLVTARTCGFHDHLNPTVATLTGSVRIQ